MLTPREREVASLMARGLGNKEIARVLGTATGTVRFQVHCVLKKLGMSTRLDLMVRLRE